MPRPSPSPAEFLAEDVWGFGQRLHAEMAQHLFGDSLAQTAAIRGLIKLMGAAAWARPRGPGPGGYQVTKVLV